MNDIADMTLDSVRARLRQAGRTVGVGRFSLVLYQPRHGDCSILHWLPAGDDPDAECREVAHGDVADCLASLDRYVARNRRPSGLEDGATTGGRSRAH